MSIWILELVNWGIAIIFIMLILEIWKWFTFKEAGAASSSQPSYLGKWWNLAKSKLPQPGSPSSKKKKVAKGLERVLARALRKAYRYNRKMYEDIKKAHRESFNTPPDKTKITNYLEEAKKFRGTVVDIDALVTDVIAKVDPVIVSNPTLKTRLDTLNKLMQKELSNIKDKLDKYGPALAGLNKSAFQAYLASMKTSCEKINSEILGLEVDVKDITKNL